MATGLQIANASHREPVRKPNALRDKISRVDQIRGISLNQTFSGESLLPESILGQQSQWAMAETGYVARQFGRGFKQRTWS